MSAELQVDWNEPEQVYPQTHCLHELFEAQAERTPDAIAVSCEGTALTYRQLDVRANQLAHALRARGVSADEPVAICVERGLTMLVGLLGILKAGGGYVPLDPSYPAQRLRYMLADAAPRVLLTQSHLQSLLPSTDCERIDLDRQWGEIAQCSEERIPVSATGVGPRHLAYVIYTSGSTGEPKGVMVEHANVTRLFASTQEWFDFNASDVWTLFHSYAFDFSVWEIWGALLYGGRLVVVPQSMTRAPDQFYRLICEEGVTILNQTPSAFRQLIEAQAHSPEQHRLRRVIFGGEALEVSTLAPWYERNDRSDALLINMYGITETTVHATYRPLQASDAQGGAASRSIGVRLPDLRLYVLDEHAQPVPIGVEGELYVGGAGVARGYLNRAELTAQRFVPDPFSKQPNARMYRSGDLARWRADGTLEYLGRNDHQVKIRGFRIELGEIEAQLLRHESVREAAVIAREDRPGEKRLVAYLVSTSGMSVPVEDLRAQLSSHLPDYMVPAAFVTLDALPLTLNGKLDRKALSAPEDAAYAHRQYSAPQGETECALAEIWRELLGVEHVGRDDVFFELGGHSLLATRVISRIRRVLAVELPIGAIFERPTIAGLSACIADQRVTADERQTLPIPALPRDEPLPLSFPQQRMWFVQQMAPNGSAYNVAIAVRMKGKLDSAALAAALNAVVKRHEAFRTKFVVTSGEPVQMILPPADGSLPEIDLCDMPLAAREPEAQRLFRQETMRPFDLSLGSPHRCLLLELEKNDHALLWVIHHAVCDQWSVGIILRDLGELYGAFGRRESPQLPALPIQYPDFAAWQRQHFGGTALAAEMAYWREKLRDLPVLTLPTDRARPTEQSYRGSYVTTTLSADSMAALKQWSARQRATPFMTLLACFEVLLARYCNQTDFAVGTPIANRTRVETEPLVGVLVNTLAMRADLSGNPSFETLLNRVRDTALGAFAHQDVPFERLVKELVGARDMSHAPLIQVLFNVTNAPPPSLRFADLELDEFAFDLGSAQFDLTLSVETELFRRVSLHYSTELFDQATAERMLAQYIGLIEQVMADPRRPITAYRLVQGAERQRIVHEWNRTESAYPADQRVDQLISEQARRTPNAVAVSMDAQKFKYAQLESDSNRLARYLRSKEVGREALVGVCLQRGPEMVCTLLAIMKAGATYVPLDPAFPKARLDSMARDAGLALCITRSQDEGALPEVSCPVVCLDLVAEEIGAHPATSLNHVGSPDDLAYVLYTSGSTGTPKGVEVSHRALVNLLWSMRTTPGCTPHDTLLAVTTLSFDIAGLELYLPLIVGGQVALASTREAADGRLLRERLEREPPTILQATPATWRMLIDAGWPGTPGLTALCGGEGLPAALAHKLLERCAAVWNVYGPTETTIWSTIQRIERTDTEISIGRPIANTSLYILDPQGEPVPVGVAGEIYIGGHGVARGYRNRAELTAGRFTTNPFSIRLGERLYRTGDLARYLPDGRVVHLGRLDFQVKIRGFRIELAEIESVLTRHAAVAQAVVAARDDHAGSKQLVGYVIPRKRALPVAADLRTFLRASLPEYMVPAQFVFLEAFPLTANRKVDVKALPAPIVERTASPVGRAEPRNRLEVQLVVLWRQVLGTDAIGIRDDFFDNGGHSLKAVQLMSAIEHLTGRQLPLATLFRAPTVAQMAELFTQSRWESAWRSLVAIQPTGRKTPIFAVPGIGGNVLNFAQLSKLLGDDQPFYGLQARGLDDTSRPFDSVVSMARHYVEEIRSVQERRPFVIIGTCAGGVVAYEMAQQLRHAGEAVVLILLETWHPSSAHAPGYLSRANMLAPLAFVLSKLRLAERQLAELPLQAWPRFVLGKVGGMRRVLSAEATETLASSSYYADRVRRATWRAISQYAPEPFDGGLLHVIAEARVLSPGTADTRRAWDELARAGCETHFIAAPDSGQLFVSPHVEQLATLVRAHVDAALRIRTPTEADGLAPEPRRAGSSA